MFALLSLKCSPAAHAFDSVRVAVNIYTLLYDLGQRSPENLGHNMTSVFIVYSEGVIVIDDGGQDHRWFGNNYFRKQGEKIIPADCAAATR